LTNEDYKHILRLIPYRVFTLLFTLIRIVRPIELLVHYDFLVREDKRQQTYDAYTQNIFASMGRGLDVNRMSSALRLFFQRGLGKKIGVQLYRHFAIAIQRHFPTTNYGIYSTDNKNEERLALMADMMAGHTTQVAEQHYARTEGVTVGLIRKADYMRVQCKDWHFLHGISTGYEEDSSRK
jgi:hypothetical protein